jgi:hypothetical protein
MAKAISQMTAAGTLTGNELVEVSRLSATVTMTRTDLSALASDNSYNTVAGNFVTAGFTSGKRVRVTGFTGNAANNIHGAYVTAVAVGKLTIGGADGDVIVDDAAGESVTITQWDTYRTTVADILAGAGVPADAVVAAAVVADNTIVRGDGGARGVQQSGVTIDDDDALHGYKANINTQTGTSYSLVASDSGKVVELVNAAAIALTVPATLAKGFACTIVQGGAGQVTLAAGSGGTQRNRAGHTKLAGQWAEGTIYVRANSGGSAAEYVFAGDSAA